MDAMQPSQQELEKRKATLRSKAAEASDSKASESGNADEWKPSWHSKYQEHVQKTQAKLAVGTSKTCFAPPPRTSGPEAPASAPAEVVRPEPKAAAASSP